MKAIESPIAHPAFPEHFNAAKGYFKLATKSWEEGKVLPVSLGGLQAVEQVMQYVLAGWLVGDRIVFRVV